MMDSMLFYDSWGDESSKDLSSSTNFADSGISLGEPCSLNNSLEVNCSSLDGDLERDLIEYNAEQLSKLELLIEESMRVHLTPWRRRSLPSVSSQDPRVLCASSRSPGGRTLRFESTFSDGLLGVLSSHYYLPKEYQHSASNIIHQLPSPLAHYWPTELLFFIFYSAVGEMLQIVASCNLFDRGWRFNMAEGLWIARVPQLPLEERTADFEVGTYQYFEAVSCSKKMGRMTLHYKDFAGRSGLPEDVRGILAAKAIIGSEEEAALAAHRSREVAARAYYKTLENNDFEEESRLRNTHSEDH